MIFFMYQGVGKTTLSQKTNMIDLQPEDFIQRNGKMYSDWEFILSNQAIRLNNEGHNVLVPLNMALYDRISKKTDEIVFVAPDLSLKEHWINKLKQRYEEDKWEPHKNAYLSALYYYDYVISDIQNKPVKIVIITKQNYDLLAILNSLLVASNYSDDSFYILDNTKRLESKKCK